MKLNFKDYHLILVWVGENPIRDTSCFHLASGSIEKLQKIRQSCDDFFMNQIIPGANKDYIPICLQRDDIPKSAPSHYDLFIVGDINSCAIQGAVK